MPKIGVMDSGVGGLSVLREIHRLLPQHATIYFADQGRAPYGPLPLDVVHRYVCDVVRYLLTSGADVIVLACHAASAASLYALRKSYPDVPFVGIEPAVKPAIFASHRRVIGVLTTQATADGALYRGVLERFATSASVITQIVPELVEMVEQGEIDTATVARSVEPLMAAGVDQIVLACTHFPFLAGAIRGVVGEAVALVDPGLPVARQVARVLPTDGDGMATRSDPHRYITSGDLATFERVASRLLGHPIRAMQNTIERG